MARRLDALLPLAEKELKAAEELFGREHTTTACALLDLARAHHAGGQEALSESFEAQARTCLNALRAKAAIAPNDPATADLLVFEADSLSAVGEADSEVTERLERALNILETALGPKDPLVAGVLGRLGESAYVRGDLETAEPFYRRAIAIFEEAHHTEDPEAVKVFEALAVLLSQKGSDREAAMLFAQAVQRPGREELDRHSFYFLLVYYADCLDRLSRGEEATGYRQRAAALLPQANPGVFGFQS